MRRLVGASLTALVLALATSTFGGATSHAASVASDRGTPWSVAVSTPEGIATDYRMLNIDHVQFRVLRIYRTTTFLHWHVGSQDPPGVATRVPPDAQSHIDPATEEMAGVVAAFNGGFKVAAKAGGAVADGLIVSSLLPGMATIALDRFGHWEMGTWGQPGFPSSNFSPVSLRQNLPPLVAAGVVAPSAVANAWMQWGDPLHGNPVQPRSGLGVDAAGNLLYLAPIKGVLPKQLGDAMVALHVRYGMELDMNPYWPTLGASFIPLHTAGPLPVQIPNSSHDPSMYFTAWERDFFVAAVEPPSSTCRWVAPGLTHGFSNRFATPQPLRLSGAHCPRL